MSRDREVESVAYQVQNVTKRYPNGKLANDNITFSMRQGEILGLFGPNGAGKTTLVKQMVGLIRPTSGRISLFGSDVGQKPELIPQRVAYLGQSDSAFGSFTFRELIIHAGVHRGLTARQAMDEANRLIRQFQCEHLSSTLRFRLSGGEKKLSLLLATVIAQRDMLILDEPTNELDPSHRSEVWRHILALSKHHGVTVLLVTHNVLEADTVVDRVGIIDAGRLQVLGTPGELKATLGDVARVEIAIKPDYERFLPNAAVHLHGRRFTLMAGRSQAMQLFNELVAAAGAEAIDDFRISTISLDDVYVQVTRKGGQADEQSTSAQVSD